MRTNDLLELAVYVYSRSVDVMCVHIHEGLRGCGYLSREYGNLTLYSHSSPSLDGRVLYVNGTNKTHDGQMVTIKFKTTEDRDYWLESLETAIKQLPDWILRQFGNGFLERAKTEANTEDPASVKMLTFKATIE